MARTKCRICVLPKAVSIVNLMDILNSLTVIADVNGLVLGGSEQQGCIRRIHQNILGLQRHGYGNGHGKETNSFHCLI